MERQERRGWVGGIVLILIGVLALFSRFIPEVFALNYAVLLLGGMALAFLVAGILTREAGWFFPAGIIGGVAAGIWATGSNWVSTSGLDDGGIFLLLFAAGWATIPITTALFSRERHWWPFILAALFAVIGLGIMYGGIFMNLTELLGYLWPLALIIGGALLIWRRRHPDQIEENPPVEKKA